MAGWFYKLGQNPIFIKEQNIRKRVTARKKFVIPSLTGYLTILLLPMVIVGALGALKTGIAYREMKGVFIAIVYIQTLYFCYRALSHSWDLISGEKEQRTYGNLISTALEAREIVLGKFWMAFYPLAGELTLLFPLFLILGLSLGIKWVALLWIYLFSLVFVAFWAMVGLYFSARVGNSASARSYSVGTLAFLTFGTYIGSLMIIGIFYNRFGASDMGAGGLLVFLPQWALTIINPFYNISMILMPSMMGDSNFIPMDGSSYSLVFYIIYPLVGLAAYYLTGWSLYSKTVRRVGEIPG